MQNFIKWLQLAMAATFVAEQTMTSDSGAAKKQRVLDMVNAEAKVAGVISPASEEIAGAAVNIIVEGFNLAGIFHHEKRSESGPSLTPQ